MKQTFKQRKCPPRCPNGSRCDRKTKKNKTRRCRPYLKKLKSISQSNKSSNKSSKKSLNKSSKKSISAPKMFRYAKFYNIAAKIQLSIDDEDLSDKDQQKTFDNKVINEDKSF